MLYRNGHPMLIDIGVGTYTKTTFSANRYSLFYMQSQYHNTPTINGVMQHAGSPYGSSNVSYHHDGSSSHFSTNIAQAYPSTAAVNKWIRSIDFDDNLNTVTVTDDYELSAWIEPSTLNFITPMQTKVTKTVQGLVLTYHNDTAAEKLEMNFDWGLFDKMETTLKSFKGDHHLTNVWGESVQRIVLVAKNDSSRLKGKFVINLK